MVQAANRLISYNIERMMPDLVEEELGRLGTGAEREALQREVVGHRHHSDVPNDCASWVKDDCLYERR